MFESVVLGLIQGLTEFLPVSSTAHLILLPWIFGWTGQVNTLVFDVALHGGTLLALLVYFRKELVRMVIKDRRLLGLILLATIPAGVVGIWLEDFVESNLRSPMIIAFCLVVFGLVMLYSEKAVKNRDFSQINFMDAMTIGLAQAIAIVPGVSRSGITISAGLFRHLNRDVAARFSFLMSVPVIGGAFLLETKKVLFHTAQWHIGSLLTGFGVAFLSGLFAIKFLLWFFKRFPLNLFVYYRVALAVIIVLLWLRG